MFYLLGMDDRSADLDATTTVRFFLLYSKDWQGPVADRIKEELQQMRSRRSPTNAELLAQEKYPGATLAVDGCELCDAPLGNPGKCVDGHSHWSKRARMCMHCHYFLAQGFGVGDGALYFQLNDGTWIHLHGEPTVPPARLPDEVSSNQTKSNSIHSNMFLLIGRIVRRAAKKSVGLVTKIFRMAGSA